MVQKRNPPAPRARPKPARRKPAQAHPPAAGVPPKRRGRPRAYEPDVALSRALDVFWKDGFAATSLDDLSAATGMNRPSLYGAFGDKRELYKKTYESYRNRARARMGEVFAADLPLRAMLLRIYGIALDMYLSGEDGPRGCFTVMTATSEAVFDPDIRAMVVSGLVEMDRVLRPPVQDRAGARRDFRPQPIRTCWRAWRRRRSTPSQSAPAPRFRAPNSRPSSTARSM